MYERSSEAEAYKAEYIKFVTEFINNHPFKDTEITESKFNRANMTADEVEKMTGEQWFNNIV